MIRNPKIQKAWSWWRGRRWWIRYPAIAAVLIAGFYGVENLRGWWAWRSYQAAAEARGDRFGLEHYRIPDPPDEENFAWAPLIQRFGNDGRKPLPVAPILNMDFLDPSLAALESPFRNIHLDIFFLACRETPLEAYFRPGSPDREQAASALKRELEPWSPILGELESATGRPGFSPLIEIQPGADYLDSKNWGSVMRVMNVLTLRSQVRLRLGDGTGSAEDLHTSLGALHHLCSDPLIPYWFPRHYFVPPTLQLVWEGLNQQVWSDETLLEINDALSRIDFRNGSIHQARIDRELMFDSLDHARDHRWAEVRVLMRGESPRWSIQWKALRFVPDAAARRFDWMEVLNDRLNLAAFLLTPNGWFDQNKVTYCRSARVATDTVTSTSAIPSVPMPTRATPYNFLIFGYAAGTPRIQHPPTVHLQRLPEITHIEALQRLTLVAVALERYQLAEGRYPTDLSELVPRFLHELPVDPYANAPPVHQLENGRPVLYSIGENARDDGGQISLDPAAGDIVWRYSLPPSVTLDDLKR